MINNATIQFPFSHSDLQFRTTYTAAGAPEYHGRARSGALESAAEWQIVKITYDANGNPISGKFADGVNDYNKVWDNRATYTYA